MRETSPFDSRQSSGSHALPCNLSNLETKETERERGGMKVGLAQIGKAHYSVCHKNGFVYSLSWDKF